MKKFRIGCILLGCILMVSYVVFNIYRNNPKVAATNLYSGHTGTTDLKSVSLRELRKGYKDTVRELTEGKYVNLEADNPLVMVTEEDSIYEIEEKSNTRYKEWDLLELVEKETAIVKSLIGDDINMDYLWDDTSWYYTDDEYNMHYPTYKETVESIKSGTYTPNNVVAQYCTYPYMAYVGVTQGIDDLRYCHVPCDFDYVVFMRGKLFELTDGQMGPDLEGDDSNIDLVAVYYKNDESLDDEYPLLNGQMSIREAISFVEDYFQHLYPYNIDSKVSEVVYKVEVFDIGKETYAFELALTRQFCGLTADSGQTAGKMDREMHTYMKDTTRVIMVEKNNVDIRIGSGNGHCMECVGQPITEVISMESALQLVSDSIGMNSHYEVEEISMIFRRKIINDTLYQQEYTGIPSWKIRCINKADGKETRFYIDLKTGRLDYYVEE